jgi:hypothetical protein
MNPRTREVELPVVAEAQAEEPWMERRSPARRTEPPGTVRTAREGVVAAEERGDPPACEEPRPEPFLFDDPYWDDAFDSYHDPTLRTCCRR